jgi:hypothetical protein
MGRVIDNLVQYLTALCPNRREFNPHDLVTTCLALGPYVRSAYKFCIILKNELTEGPRGHP